MLSCYKPITLFPFLIHKNQGLSLISESVRTASRIFNKLRFFFSKEILLKKMNTTQFTRCVARWHQKTREVTKIDTLEQS